MAPRPARGVHCVSGHARPVDPSGGTSVLEMDDGRLTLLVGLEPDPGFGPVLSTLRPTPRCSPPGSCGNRV
jgi:hypothetical protein